MKMYIIAFFANDLLSSSIRSRIKERYAWARLNDNTYIIKANNINTNIIRDDISDNINGDYRLFVTEVTNSSWSSYKVPTNITNWIKE